MQPRSPLSRGGPTTSRTPHPNIILGIEDWQKKATAFPTTPPQLIERSREFMNKLHSGIEELPVRQSQRLCTASQSSYGHSGRDPPCQPR